MSAQKSFSRGLSIRRRSLNYDSVNLQTAEYVLARRSEYEKPGYRCVLIWAETVMRRLGNKQEKTELSNVA